MPGTSGPLRGRRVLAVLTLALSLVACGGDEPADDAGPALPPPTAPSPSPSPDAGSPASDAPAPGETTEASRGTYTVEPGDTLSEIAQRLGTTVEALVEANDLDDPDRISPGQQLRIP